jgi:hypothetical protein
MVDDEEEVDSHVEWGCKVCQVSNLKHHKVLDIIIPLLTFHY